MTGFLTTKRYKYATVYVDQFSRLGFVFLQKTATAEETVEGKRAFEAYARRHGVLRIENYHADNGIFKAHHWVKTCKQDGQGVTYAGVNAHHQNGVAERRIRELQELARTMLIHANARWSDSVTANLWPYAIRTANKSINHTPSFQDSARRTPMEIFTGSKVVSNPKHWKPFGCPTYVLNNELQGQKPYHKWRQRSKPGVYLGRSPLHGRNVSLVLDRDTGLVSPQFHVAFDPTFDTVKDITTKSNWQIKAGFVAQREPEPQTKKSEIGPTPYRTTVGSRKRKHTETSMEQGNNPEPRNDNGVPAIAPVGNDGSPMPRTEGESPVEATGERVDNNDQVRP
jgi:hypothetical protein